MTWLRTSTNETTDAQSIATAAAAIPVCMAPTKDCCIASRTSRLAPAVPPVAADEPARATMRAAAPAGIPAFARWARNARVNTAVVSAPSEATPSTPPSSRLVLAAAEASPTRPGSAEPMTAVDIGASVMAQPAPMARTAGSSTAV